MALLATGAARLIGRMIRSPLDARDASNSHTQTSVLRSLAEEQRWISERESVESVFLVKWGGVDGEVRETFHVLEQESSRRNVPLPLYLGRMIKPPSPSTVASQCWSPLSSHPRSFLHSLPVSHPDVSEKRI